ncbi:hypothetical protein J7337_012954 [Fusarium musae]|uniref:AB hydrolase-1 domain-containing protein n=1 Tax=Fusarium musae TaxID=1042133 RepID=A0A9P8D6W4_9HYPO|nr:hypothetical protein J7337_012954 [Fusarium musae]KAG9496366.1 hypothetical protein J7337_012954 [Fusarium musae]
MAFSYSTYTTTRALNYSYIHILPRLPNTRYLLFLHGFPSTSYHWRHQIPFFKAKGYGIIAPDLLGFGETSRPTELEMYKGEDMARDIVEILTSEGIGTIVGVAHDWYVKSVEAKLGFSILGYFLLFDDDDAPTLLDEHSESVESLYFSTDEEITKKYKGALGGLRAWLTEGKTTELPAHLTSEDHKYYKSAFSKEKSGYGGAINWYRAGLRNINEEDERKITTDAYILTHPTLLITSTNVITAAMDIPEQMRPFVTDFIVEQVTGGHWLQLEKPDEVNEILDKFVTEVGN